MQKIKKIISFIFNKETLFKIILIQIIFILLAFMGRGGLVVYHKGSIGINNSYGGFDININQ